MNDTDIDAFMDAAGPLLGLAIDPAWRAGVRANLLVLFAQAHRLAAVPLPDEAEPAPVFRP